MNTHRAPLWHLLGCPAAAAPCSAGWTRFGVHLLFSPTAALKPRAPSPTFALPTSNPPSSWPSCTLPRFSDLFFFFSKQWVAASPEEEESSIPLRLTPGICHGPRCTLCPSRMDLPCSDPFSPSCSSLYHGTELQTRQPGALLVDISIAGAYLSSKSASGNRSLRCNMPGQEIVAFLPWTRRVHLVKKESLLYFDISCRFE